MADYLRLSLMRKPSWRYERALSALPTPGFESQPTRKLSRKRDDYLVFGLRKFLQDYRRSADPVARENVFARHPLYYLAYEIEVDVDSGFRHLIQARILAKQTDEEIASLVNTCPEVIDLYEKCFYNVRDRIDRSDWILRQIYGRQASMSQSDEQTMLKLFAYYAGPMAIEFLTTGFSGVRHIANAQELGPMLDTYMTSAIRRRASLHSNTFEVNRYNITQLLELHTKIVEIDRAASRDGKPQDLVEKVIHEFCVGNPWITGTAGADSMGDLIEYDKGAEEVRDDELHRAARGEAIDVPAIVYAEHPDDKGKPIKVSPIFEARTHRDGNGKAAKPPS